LIEFTLPNLVIAARSSGLLGSVKVVPSGNTSVGYAAITPIDGFYELGCLWVLVNVNFDITNFMVIKELFNPSTITAPGSSVND
jgi:hypothetical protein